jgi:abhydrolase domain-containing protein 1/3
MPLVASPAKPADVAGGVASGSGHLHAAVHDANSDTGSNDDTSGSFDRADAPAGASGSDETDDDTDSRVSDPSGVSNDDPNGSSSETVSGVSATARSRSLPSRLAGYATRTAARAVRSTVATLGFGHIFSRVLDEVISDEICVPSIVHGGDALTRELLDRKKCPTLYDAYTPPWWCANPHAQTIVGYGRMLTLFLKYDRQIVRCEDGGSVALDWLVSSRFGSKASASVRRAAARKNTNAFGKRPSRFAPRFSIDRGRSSPVVGADTIPDASTLPLDAPVFIMLHGINGGSHEGPTKWAIATAASRGWRCVALNLRGCGGSVLTSPKVYCAASSSDVRAAVDACHALYPAAPILLSAYSLGTYVVGTYLAEEDSKPGGARRRNVAGAVLTSCPMEPHSSYAGLSDPEKPTGLLYNGAVAAKLREYFFKHEVAVHEHPEVDAKALNIAAMRTVADFEKAVIVVTHGFKDVEEYYAYFSPARIIPSVRTPALYLVATDDPFLGDMQGVERAIRASKFVSLAHVARGGHVAFLEKGVGVFGQCWTERVTGEFLQAALDPRSAEAEAAAARAGAVETIIARDIPGVAGRRIVARTSIAGVRDEDEAEDGHEERRTRRARL